MWAAGLLSGLRAAARSLTALGWAVLVACVAVLLLLATCSHYSAREADHAKRAAEERAKALDEAMKASDKAAGERLWDIKINQKREKELTDAVTSLPDAAPSPVQRRLACQRLRHQGTRDTDLPAVCRSEG